MKIEQLLNGLDEVILALPATLKETRRRFAHINRLLKEAQKQAEVLDSCGACSALVSEPISFLPCF